MAPIPDWQIRENGLGPEAPVERFDPGQELRSVVHQGLELGVVRGSTPTSRHDDDVIGGWLADQRRGSKAATDPKAGGLSPGPVFEDVAVAVELQGAVSPAADDGDQLLVEVPGGLGDG